MTTKQVFNTSAELNYPTVLPTLDLDFANSKTLDPRITFTRSSGGSYVGADGLIKYAGVNEARFDHNPVTGESLGLLIEEPRTNLLTYSENTSQWLAPTNVTLTQDQVVSPDGTLTADQYLETTATGLHVQDGMPFAFVTSTVYTYSVFVKSIGGRNFEIGFPATIFTARFARFTLSGSGSVRGADAGITAGIQAYSNGWYRCWATATCAAGVSSRIGNFINNSTYSRFYAGDPAKGIYLWGAQLEVGAFPTSYIPTVASTRTRAADNAQITGTNFSSWYNQSEGSIYLSAIPYYSSAVSGFNRLISINDGSIGSQTNTIQVIIFNTINEILGSVWNTSINQFGIAKTITSGTKFKVSLGIAPNNCAGSFDGAASGRDVSAIIPTMNQMSIGSYNNTQFYMTMHISRLTYYPKRLSNSQLQALTR